jgi:GTP1/Obg family GTP-binding protein
MEESFNQEVRPILETFDKIREVLGNEKIDLPSIVVIGIQSSGKSSVLENIS